MNISFSTNIYEKTYKHVLLDGFLQGQLDIIGYDFFDKIITVNNVENKKLIADLIRDRFSDFRYFFTGDRDTEVLEHFDLTKNILEPGYIYSIHHFYQFYYGASDYHFHVSADCPIKKFDKDFIRDSIDIMESHDDVICSMPSWTADYVAAKEESVDTIGDFYKAQGFTDQVYLAKKKEFCKKIYHYWHPDSSRYPSYGANGFERRTDSYMKVNQKFRIIHKKSYYTHERT